MGWATIIAAILQIVGPLISEWLKKCGEEKAAEAIERLPSFESFPDEYAARDALFDEMISALPRRAFARRGLLRRLKAVAGKSSALTLEDTAEIRDLACSARQE